MSDNASPTTPDAPANPTPSKRRVVLIAVAVVVVLALVVGAIIWAQAPHPPSEVATPTPTPASPTASTPTPQPTPTPTMPTPQWSASPSWQTALSGSDIDQFADVTVAPDGSVYAVGFTRSNDQDFAGSHATSDSKDAMIAKFTTTGQRVWVKTFGGAGDDDFDAVTVAPDGGIVVSGYTDSTDGNLITPSNTGAKTALVAKISADGDLVWATSVGDNSWAELFGVTMAADGSVYAVGSGLSDNAGGFGAAAKLTADGKVVWAKTYGTAGVSFWAVAAAPTGGVVVVGDTPAKTGALQSNPDTPKNQDDGLMVKLAGDGTMSWHKNVPGTYDIQLDSVAVAPDGSFIATAGGLIVRTDATGKVISQNTATPVTANQISGLAVLPNNDIVMANVDVPGSKTSASVVTLRNDTDLQFTTAENSGVYVFLKSVATTADGTTAVAVGTLMGSGDYAQDAFIVSFKIS